MGKTDFLPEFNDALAEIAEAMNLPLVSLGVKVIRRTVKASREQRVKEFFHRLESDRASELEIKSWLKEPEGAAYFTTIAQWMFEDDEDEKAEFYAEAFRTLARGIVPRDRRMDFATAFRSLRTDDLRRLHEWVAQMRMDEKQNQRENRNADSQWHLRTGHSADDLTLMAVQRCKLAGVLRDYAGNGASTPTGLGCLIAEHSLSYLLSSGRQMAASTSSGEDATEHQRE